MLVIEISFVVKKHKKKKKTQQGAKMNYKTKNNYFHTRKR